MEGSDELLRMELDENYSFVRHHFQLYLGWYTFFLTVNFAAIGWFTSVLVTGNLKASQPVILVGIFFIFQLIFSYFAILQVRTYFITAERRCCQLIRLLPKVHESHLRPCTVIPLAIYLKRTDLMRYTLISFSLFRVALPAVAIHMVPLA